MPLPEPSKRGLAHQVSRLSKLFTSKQKKHLYRKTDLLDVGLVVQKARKQGYTAPLQWGLIGFYYNKQSENISKI